VAVDPHDSSQQVTLDKWFEFELTIPETRVHAMGERAYVRFEHAAEPLAMRLYRSVRQLFLRRFTV
jgi:putative peptide zinc metalloprotease protein